MAKTNKNGKSKKTGNRYTPKKPRNGRTMDRMRKKKRLNLLDYLRALKDIGNKKFFTLDTSTIVHDPQSPFRLGDNIVVIPDVVLVELDSFKGEQHSNRGQASRDFSRCIEKHMDNLDNAVEGLPNCYKTEVGGLIIFDWGDYPWTIAPKGLPRNNDGKILLTAIAWKKEFSGSVSTVVTKDRNLGIRSRNCGVSVEDYKKDLVVFTGSGGSLYSGCKYIDVDESEAGLFTDWRIRESVPVSEIIQLEGFQFLPNECVIFSAGDKRVAAVYNHKAKKLKFISSLEKSIDGKIRPRNTEQQLAYQLMMDESLDIVTLVGIAGTGKTIMALLAANDKLDASLYDAILVYRPVIVVGQEIGFLPGNLDEKFAHQKLPIYDNLLPVLGSKGRASVSNGKAKETENDMISKKHGRFDRVLEMERAGILEIGPVTFIRGRSIKRSFIIVDEAQNLTPHEMKTIVSRVEDSSRIIICGDKEQVDNKYLDTRNNGLTYLVERFKGQTNFGHIVLTEGERGRLAQQAAELL